MKFNNWTITKANGTPLPYGLYQDLKTIGYFATVEEAKAEMMKLTKGNKNG